MSPWTGGAPTGSFWGGIARGSVEPAERLAAKVARRAQRRSATQKDVAVRLGDELAALGDAAASVPIEHLDAFGEAGSSTLARTLVRRLRDGHRRDEAMDALSAIGERAVWPLAHVLHDRHIGLFAARVLAQIGEPAVPAVLLVLTQARRSPDCEDWDPAAANATTALAGIGAPALGPVLRLLDDREEHPNVRTGVVHVLARMGDIGALHLVTALGDPDPQVRDAAAAALARLGS